jgi:hypothetical protein
VRHPSDEPDTLPGAIDLAALHDALDASALATFKAEDGDRDEAELALLEASMAGAAAFPAGSAEARALAVVFSAISRAASGTANEAGGGSPAAAVTPGQWMDGAACRDEDPAMFFDSGREAEALAVCATCLVRAYCLDYAMAKPELFGTWGGLGEQARRLVLAAASGETRKCTSCGQRKLLTEFAANGHGDWLKVCQLCKNAAQRKSRRAATTERTTAATAAEGDPR